MIIELYGKQDCGLCKSARKKIDRLLARWQIERKVRVVMLDVDTPDGAAESDFHDVFDIPSVLLKHDGELVARWDGAAPNSNELHQRLSA